ncbi:hypothetical protein BGZ93_002328 [Podila epicladia]|nr:hypothetical protein BGZ92_004725 [Podila epicladia]KAG0082651.1 hypothetical protein BGZ93_002328 [Podila epicladia]
MHFISTIALLSTAVALTSATKLQSAMTQLCLDAFNGLSNGAGLYMGPCDQVKHGNWQILQSNEQVWLHSNEDTGANGGQGWCVDMNPSRNKSPTVWQCNGGANQRFIRDPRTSAGKWSFMTTFKDPQWGEYVLSSTSNTWGSPADIGLVTATSGTPTGMNFEWNYIN